MQIELFLGFAGLFTGLCYRIPQIYKIHKTKSGKDISIPMIHLQNISYGFYIAYGILANDIVYILSSCVGVFQNLLIIALCYYQHRKECSSERDSNLASIILK
jgi:uncharacterized protein with PQ loop repeat